MKIPTLRLITLLNDKEKWQKFSTKNLLYSKKLYKAMKNSNKNHINKFRHPPSSGQRLSIQLANLMTFVDGWNTISAWESPSFVRPRFDRPLNEGFKHILILYYNSV
jgi:hypothetical protein